VGLVVGVTDGQAFWFDLFLPGGLVDHAVREPDDQPPIVISEVELVVGRLRVLDDRADRRWYVPGQFHQPGPDEQSERSDVPLLVLVGVGVDRQAPCRDGDAVPTRSARLRCPEHCLPALKSLLRPDDLRMGEAIGVLPVAVRPADERNRRTTVPTRAADLLVVAVDRLWNTGVDHGANVILVHTEAKR
jgi:hypothetical protein